MFNDITIDLQLKTRVFQFAFSGLSSKLEIVSRLSLLVIEEFKQLYGSQSLEQVFEVDEGYFFNNLFAKIRYFSTGMSDKHVHLCLISLKDYAPKRMATVLI